MMRLLKLFRGTGYIGNAFREEGWEAVSLDINPRSKATIIIDIRTWSYKAADVGEFDVIRASPCCTHCSCARRNATSPRNLEWADSLVSKSLETR